jgi:DNA-binding Xre family transcriptional regulator
MIHIGNLLNELFEKRRIRRAALARTMNINLANLMKYEKKESIQTARLYELCHHLQHNFFMDIAQTLPPDYATSKDIFEEKDQQIEELKKQVEKLTIERDVLLKVKG